MTSPYLNNWTKGGKWVCRNCLTIDQFPPEILLKIFEYLPIPIVQNVARLVCMRWRELVDNHQCLCLKLTFNSIHSKEDILKQIEKSRRLFKLNIYERNDVSEIIEKVAESQRSLCQLSCRRAAQGRELRLRGPPLCALVAACPHLRRVHLVGYTVVSNDFFRIIPHPPLYSTIYRADGDFDLSKLNIHGSREPIEFHGLVSGQQWRQYALEFPERLNDQWNIKISVVYSTRQMLMLQISRKSDLEEFH